MKFMKITNVHYTEKQQSSQEAAAEEQDATLRFSGGWGRGGGIYLNPFARR